jgi:hypothetical protein
VHTYEVRPRKDKRGVDLISDALPFGRLWYGEPFGPQNLPSISQIVTSSYTSRRSISGTFVWRRLTRQLCSVRPQGLLRMPDDARTETILLMHERWWKNEAE